MAKTATISLTKNPDLNIEYYNQLGGAFIRILVILATLGFAWVFLHNPIAVLTVACGIGAVTATMYPKQANALYEKTQYHFFSGVLGYVLSGNLIGFFLGIWLVSFAMDKYDRVTHLVPIYYGIKKPLSWLNSGVSWLFKNWSVKKTTPEPEEHYTINALSTTFGKYIHKAVSFINGSKNNATSNKENDLPVITKPTTSSVVLNTTPHLQLSKAKAKKLKAIAKPAGDTINTPDTEKGEIERGLSENTRDASRDEGSHKSKPWYKKLKFW